MVIERTTQCLIVIPTRYFEPTFADRERGFCIKQEVALDLQVLYSLLIE